jgi:SAM-dependent methyltransferase
MADKLRPILDAYLGGGMPPNIALMRLCMEATSPEEVRGAVEEAQAQVADTERRSGHLSPPGRGGEAEPPGPNLETVRLEALSNLLEQHPSAFATIREVMAEAEHDTRTSSPAEAVAHWAAVFGRLAEAQPEAGVALYALGSPELLEAATAEIVAALRSWNLLTPYSRALEIGCGIGRFVRAIAPEVAHVTGLDLAPGMIARAHERCYGLANVRLEVSSGRDLAGLAASSFDLVLAADVFPYLVQAGDELAACHIAEAARVLRPGGTLAILNYSYRGDINLDRREVAASAEQAGFAATEEPAPAFRYWDGSVFLLRMPL